MQAAKSISEVNLAEPCAIIMGGEEHGVYPALMKVCDERIRIPMPGDFDSLNVSVASGIILYEAAKQRQAGEK
jgi:23S rRNA (guanosine2251-2'-O)-methyltransferase